MFTALLNAYLSLQAAYYVGCALCGTPTCQPTLYRVYQCTLTALVGSSTHVSEGPYWQFRLKHLWETIIHLLWWRPLFGCLLFMDDILLGWKQQKIKKPLFVMSGARSGSTTLGHLLEEDTSLCGPPMLFCVFPFLTLWILLDATLRRFISKRQFENFLTSIGAGEEMQVRHEFHPMKPDTYDVPMASRQWWGLIMLHCALPHPDIYDNSLWFHDLPKNEQERALDMIDQTGKKWLQTPKVNACYSKGIKCAWFERSSKNTVMQR